MNLSTMSYHSNSCNCNNVDKNTFSQCQFHHLRLPSGTHQSAKNNLSNENRKIEHVSADVVASVDVVASADIDNFDPYTMIYILVLVCGPMVLWSYRLTWTNPNPFRNFPIGKD